MGTVVIISAPWWQQRKPYDQLRVSFMLHMNSNSTYTQHRAGKLEQGEVLIETRIPRRKGEHASNSSNEVERSVRYETHAPVKFPIRGSSVGSMDMPSSGSVNEEAFNGENCSVVREPTSGE